MRNAKKEQADTIHSIKDDLSIVKRDIAEIKMNIATILGILTNG